MHPSLRLFTARLPPFSVTGLTGVLTHPNPRPTLIALYNHTLTLLSQLPAHSVYRQSTENLTRHRLNIIESVKPPGYEAYKQELEAAKEKAGVKDRKDTAFELNVVITQARSFLEELERPGNNRTVTEYLNTEKLKWEFLTTPGSVPPGTAEDDGVELAGALEDKPAGAPPIGQMFHPGAGSESRVEAPLLPMEPELTAEQVSEVEEKFGAGLIEEVIDQGWAELKLVKDMEDAKVWEELEFVPEEGQWVGFERTP